MTNEIYGKRIAFLVADGFEQSELSDCAAILTDHGAETCVVSIDSGHVQGWNQGDWAEVVRVDESVYLSDPSSFDGLVIPGGIMSSDRLRSIPQAVNFVRSFFETGKTVGAIGRAAWLLIDAEVVRNRRVTSWPSIQADLRNAGAHWEDREVVTDGALITARKPSDIHAFTGKLIETLQQGIHQDVTRYQARLI